MSQMVEAVHTIECIAVVGKQNNPLYLKNFTEKPELDLHYFVNVSLDAIEERLVRWTGRPPKEAPMKTLLQEIYTAYISLASNPFYTIDSEVRGQECSKFVNFINTLKL